MYLEDFPSLPSNSCLPAWIWNWNNISRRNIYNIFYTYPWKEPHSLWSHQYNWATASIFAFPIPLNLHKRKWDPPFACQKGLNVDTVCLTREALHYGLTGGWVRQFKASYLPCLHGFEGWIKRWGRTRACPATCALPGCWSSCWRLTRALREARLRRCIAVVAMVMRQCQVEGQDFSQLSTKILTP